MVEPLNILLIMVLYNTIHSRNEIVIALSTLALYNESSSILRGSDNELKALVSFDQPNLAWERDTNENTDGLIRQYFPKGSDFYEITEQDINFVMNRLDHRLGFWNTLHSKVKIFMLHLIVEFTQYKPGIKKVI